MESYNTEVRFHTRLRLDVVVSIAAALALPGLAAPAPPQQPPPTQQQTPPPPPPPVPRPFPGSRPPDATATKPPASAETPALPAALTQTPASTGAPTEAALGVKFFPGATYLESVDLGQNQRVYLFGTNASYAEVVAFYKAELRTGGRELLRTPGTHQFDLGRFQEATMAAPPAVVVKDYTWTGVHGGLTEGYLFVDGTTEKRFKTIVQVVPASTR